MYEQAFFPFYPTFIRFVSGITRISDVSAAFFISHAAFLGGLLFYFSLVKSLLGRRSAIWSVTFLLLFPMSFYFAAVYSESLFFLLASVTLWAAMHKRWLVVGVAGMLASYTRFFGIFLFPVVLWQWQTLPKRERNFADLFALLLMPVGLIAYMAYLAQTIGDPLMFFHAQPAFGANRTGSTLVLLPQVVWRYMKIFMTAQPWTLTYVVSLLEFLAFLLGAALLWRGLRRRFLPSFLLYSAAVVLVPTLTGTLSSLPRYLLSAPPLFFILGNMHNTKIKAVIAILFGIGLIVFAAAFLQGHFVS